MNCKRDIHEFFGLTYANYIAIPRSILQSMPEKWQHKFVELLEELDETFEWRREGCEINFRLPSGRYAIDALADYQRTQFKVLRRNDMNCKQKWEILVRYSPIEEGIRYGATVEKHVVLIEEHELRELKNRVYNAIENKEKKNMSNCKECKNFEPAIKPPVEKSCDNCGNRNSCNKCYEICCGNCKTSKLCESCGEKYENFEAVNENNNMCDDCKNGMVFLNGTNRERTLCPYKKDCKHFAITESDIKPGMVFEKNGEKYVVIRVCGDYILYSESYSPYRFGNIKTMVTAISNGGYIPRPDLCVQIGKKV